MSEDRERRQEGTQAGQSPHGAPTERAVEQDGYVDAADEAKTAERTEEEDRAED